MWPNRGLCFVALSLGWFLVVSEPKIFGQIPLGDAGVPLASPQETILGTTGPTEPALPPNPYEGDLFSRGRLTGDWGGLRSALAEKGLTFDLSATQFYQGVVDGGRERRWEYGGKLDYFVNLDGGKLGLWQGLFVNLHAETRYGRSVNEIDGLLTPSNIAMTFPLPDRDITSITGLKVTQALSENFAVFAGKINTLDEYPIHYGLYRPELGIHHPGLGGFMNTSLVFNPILGRTTPYSAAAVGAALIADGQPVLTVTVLDPKERATIGLEDLFEQGVVIVADLILRPKLFGRPGIINVGGNYSNANYRSLSPESYLNIPPQLLLTGAVRPQETGSWALYSNFYQSVWVDSSDEKRNWGVFGQLGLSDGNPNPVRYVVNGGIGGASMIPGRPIDTFGVGAFYLGLSDNFKALTAPLLPQKDEYGLEVFYNFALTPWCRLTADVQAVRPSTRAVDPVLIAGLRLQILF